ncbi:hypothetical protein [Terricaulis sp.]|uniref:hypothetical protein n=1 Tax=Terricaulis sp. TaxID=2768686 RepID=UPI0037844B32
MLNKVFAIVMAVSGLLTMTMLYAAVAPAAAMQSMFGDTVDTDGVIVVIRNWGILIALMGALLIYGAWRPQARKLALVVAGASKIAFIALVLSHGDRFLAGLGVAVAIDSVMVLLFATYVMLGRPAAG